jgi:hypothetical protein
VSQKSAAGTWLSLGTQAWLLGMESANVITLRMLRVAGGGAAAQAETQRMRSEKMMAAALLQMQACFGLLGHTAPDVAAGSVRHYSKVVRANRKRLSRG